MQHAWRRMRGVDAAEMAMVRRVYARHLGQALRLKR
jgi:hypothetical protein